MLRRLTLRDFVIVPELELELQPGFTVLTGETGAGKSILIDALQLALGSRADAGVVREGAARAEISAEFDNPPGLMAWLDNAGFGADDSLLLRRSIDSHGKSRAWINGSPATAGQLREAGDLLVDIHGQHAWHSLTRPAAARALLDSLAGLDSADLARRFALRQQAQAALDIARQRGDELAQERERLAWQISELNKLAPAEQEWDQMSAEHQRLAHAQALIDAARLALAQVDGADGPGGRGETSGAQTQASRAREALSGVSDHDPRIAPIIDALDGALAQLQDASHGLSAYLARAEPDPGRLQALDSRMSAWMGLARRWRRPPADLPTLLQQWQQEMLALDAAGDTAALAATLEQANQHYQHEAQRISQGRQTAAGPLGQTVSQAMQGLGMAGGHFEVALLPLESPQASGLETVEFLVTGHAGSMARPLAKVASGGELSRLALAIAVTSVQRGAEQGQGAATLIFDEVDAGIGGAVGDAVGALMKQLGRSHQVLAVTHLAQVAACADQHLVVSKAALADGRTASSLQAAQGQGRVAEVARMLGGEHMADTSLAHAQAMLQSATAPIVNPSIGSSRRRSSKA